MKIIALIALLNLSLQSHVPPKKQLNVRYFYNSGWLIETDRHAIVIDFIPHEESGSSITYLEQLLKQLSAKGKRPMVFITHDHQDHFTPAILDLAKSFRSIEFIFGWQYKPATTARFRTFTNRESLSTPEYEIYTHPATDDGVGFLIQIDGLNIYHAGDHALWADQLTDQFTSELNYIATKSKHIDLAFIPAARGMFTKCAYDSTIQRGIEITAKTLHPDAIALQHLGCQDKFNVYQQAHEALKPTIKAKQWLVPRRYNQQFSLK